MPAEYVYNTLTSFIEQAAGVGAGDVSFQLVDVALFPSVCNYRIVVDAEIMIVTACVAGLLTVTRGQEGTTASAHANNAPVTITVTAGGLYAVFTALP